MLTACSVTHEMSRSTVLSMLAVHTFKATAGLPSEASSEPCLLSFTQPTAALRCSRWNARAVKLGRGARRSCTLCQNLCQRLSAVSAPGFLRPSLRPRRACSPANQDAHPMCVCESLM